MADLTTLKTTGELKGLYADKLAFPSEEVTQDALINQVTTKAKVLNQALGDGISVRVPYSNPNPGTGFVKELEDINQINPGIHEAVIKTGKLADLAIASNEATDNDDAIKLLTKSMAKSIGIKADQAFLNSTTAEASLGLTKIEGIPDTFTVDKDLDPIQDALINIRAHQGDPEYFICSPDFWGKISKMKQADKSLVPLLGNPATEDGLKLFGLTVIVTAQMPEKTALIIDPSVIYSAQSPIEAVRSEHRYFDKDATAFRISWRIGWAITHKERLAKIKAAA